MSKPVDDVDAVRQISEVFIKQVGQISAQLVLSAFEGEEGEGEPRRERLALSARMR